MKAIINTRYGPPDSLQLVEKETPEPKEDEIRVRVHAATVTAGDCEMRRFQIAFLFWLPLRLVMGVFKPRLNVLGQEFSGVVDAVGANVSGFAPGDAVFAPTDMTFGAYAEYKCLSQKSPMVKKPGNISFEEAATIPTGGLNALHFLRLAKTQPGESILVIGAGGSIGTYAIQLAKNKGLVVTAVDKREKLDLLRSIGADHVIDYENTNYLKSQERYDVVFDIVGKWWSETYAHLLTKGGRYLVTNPGITTMLKALVVRSNGRRIINGLAGYRKEDLQELADLMEQGKIKSVIDAVYPIEEAAKAHTYVDSGQKKGNIVLKFSQ